MSLITAIPIQIKTQRITLGRGFFKVSAELESGYRWEGKLCDHISRVDDIAIRLALDEAWVGTCNARRFYGKIRSGMDEFLHGLIPLAISLGQNAMKLKENKYGEFRNLRTFLDDQTFMAMHSMFDTNNAQALAIEAWKAGFRGQEEYRYQPL